MNYRSALFLILVCLLIDFISSSLYGEQTDVVKPQKEDVLKRITLTRSELGGELNRRIEDLIYKNYMVLDLDANWLNHFRNREVRGTKNFTYYGIGKVIDAGSLFAAYSGDPKVLARTRYLVDELRKTRDPNGYLGFWTVEPENRQNHINWILHEQEYINLALTRYYRSTGESQGIQDARIMADYIMKSFPANKEGIYHIPAGISIAGITEGFIELYRLTGDDKYRIFALNVQYEPHWIYEPYDEWVKNIDKRPFHLYVMISHLYPETELYRLTGNEEYLKKSQWLKRALLEKGHGALLVTGSSSQGEYFTYNQDGTGAVEESCVTAYLLRLFDSLMRIEGDLHYGNVMERTIYNALFAAQSPDGRRICYFTPFSGKRIFQTIDTFCCNGNFRRAVAELPQKVWFQTKNDGIVLNLYSASDKTFTVKGTSVRIQEQTDYPNSGNVQLTFTVTKPIAFAFQFRTPRWCDAMTITVNNEKPIIINPKKQINSSCELNRTWQTGDIVKISMPMEWRLVRGRSIQAGRVALLRGPLLFGIGQMQNAELLKSVSSPRELVLDPTGIGAPLPDSSIRPEGIKVKAKVWTSSNMSEKPKEVILTEFTDPDSVEVYFKLPEKIEASSIPIVDDELFTVPAMRSYVNILAAFYGPKENRPVEEYFNVRGTCIANLARDYIRPEGKFLTAEFPCSSNRGNWSVYACPNGGTIPSKSKTDRGTLLHSQYDVYATPIGFAYGQSDPDKLGFISDHTPSPNQGPLWKQNFTEQQLDKAIPTQERNDYLYHHPVSNPKSNMTIHWEPNRSKLSNTSKSYIVHGTIITRQQGNGVVLSVEGVKKTNNGNENTILQTVQTNEGTSLNGTNSISFIQSIPIETADSLNFIIENNGSHNCDSTAIKLHIYETDHQDRQRDVTGRVNSKYAGQFKTNLGRYRDLFGPVNFEGSGSLKLKLYDPETKKIFYQELPDNTVLDMSKP